MKILQNFLNSSGKANPGFSVFLQTEDLDFSEVLQKLELPDWHVMEDLKAPEIPGAHQYVIAFAAKGTWIHLLDKNYVIGFEKGIHDRLRQLSNLCPILAFIVGDVDGSFAYRRFEGGKLIREFVIEYPYPEGRTVSANHGHRETGESEALATHDPDERLEAVAKLLGIEITYQLSELTFFTREEREDERFEFNEEEY